MLHSLQVDMNSPNSIKATLQDSSRKLHAVSDSPSLDAELLLCHVLGKTRTWLRTYPEQALNQKELIAFHDLLDQRLQSIPIAYLTGKKEFWSLTLTVNRHTLIPRPETEQLVELSLEFLQSRKKANILDLGTGSGCIALAIASERPDLEITATDKNKLTLQTAIQNARDLDIQNVKFIESDWFHNIPRQHFDLIISNPPYIAEADPHLTRGDVQFEPQQALVSTSEGLEDIEIIVRESQKYLSNNGQLIVEHGYDQQPAVIGIFQECGFTDTRGHQDLAGQPRCVSGTKTTV